MNIWNRVMAYLRLTKEALTNEQEKNMKALITLICKNIISKDVNYSFSDVPKPLKETVAKVLTNSGYGHLADDNAFTYEGE